MPVFESRFDEHQEERATRFQKAVEENDLKEIVAIQVEEIMERFFEAYPDWVDG